MIDWILTELEKQPSRLFYEKELGGRDAHEFARLKEGKLLTYAQPDDHGDVYGLGQRLPLTVKKIRGQYWAFSEDDSEADPILLERSDLNRYRLCLEQFAQQLRLVNSLSGASFQLDRRQFFLGEKSVDSQKVAFIFGLFDADRGAKNLLLSLPAQLGRKVDSIVVITPSYEAGSALLASQLQSMKIHVVPRRATEDWRVDVSTLLREVPGGLPASKLTAEQEGDYERYGYNCKLPLYITGRRTDSGSNLVEVGGTFVEIGEVPFSLFLRLVLELRRNKVGTVPKTELKSEGYLSEDGEYQSIGRLRQCFVRALGDLHPNKFVEAHPPKMLRISVHPYLITWDAEKLSAHDDPRIRELAKQLTRVAYEG